MKAVAKIEKKSQKIMKNRKKCAYPHSREDIKEAGATVFNQKIVCMF